MTGGGDCTDSFVLFSFVFSNEIGMIRSLGDALFALVSGSKDEALENNGIDMLIQKNKNLWKSHFKKSVLMFSEKN